LEAPLVQQILQIAEDHLIHKNKVLSAERLYNLAKSRLNRPRKELILIIQWLFEQRILVEGSKLSKDILLKNQNRHSIYEFIKAHLAVNFSTIQNNLSSETLSEMGSPGQIIWHLQMLIKYGFIKRIKYKSYSLFCPAEIDSDLCILIFLLKDEINKKIILLLLNNDSVKRSDAFKYIDEGREVVYYRLKNLLDLKILSEVEAESKEIELNPMQKKNIHQILNILDDLKLSNKKLNGGLE
jgi:predicted transcriptional regulator